MEKSKPWRRAQIEQKHKGNRNKTKITRERADPAKVIKQEK
jgi:hypothetical protein